MQVCYVIYQHKEVCDFGARGFVVIYHWRKMQDGRYIIVSKSVDHPIASHKKDGVIIGNIYFSGWIIEDCIPSGGAYRTNHRKSRVQYLNCVDLKESRSSAGQKLLVKQQPLIISKIKKLFVY
jgi:hypothetical protein